MTFTEATKRDAEEKYQQLDSGSLPSPITPPDMDSFSQFEQKSKKFHERLTAQDNELKRALDTINANKKARLAAEAAEKKRIEDAALAEKKKAEAAEKARLAEIKQQERLKSEKEGFVLSIVFYAVIAIVAIGIVVGAIFGIRAIVRGVQEKEQTKLDQEAANYSLNNIAIVVTGKESTIERGWSTKYVNVFSFSITNNCLKDIEYIEGKMAFFDGEEEIGNSTVYFRSEIDSTRTAKMTVEFSGTDEVYKLLYATPFDKMKIEYKITSITFQDNEQKTYDEGYKVIKTASDKSDEGPFDALKYASVGQTVTLGKFETNCDFNTTEDLEWIVVKKEGGKVLLISKMSLLAMPYGDYSQESYVSWKNSEIRSFLNGDFYYNCFTEEERALMSSTTIIPTADEINLGALQTTDKIFIPTTEELSEMFYSSKDMRCLSTGNIWSDGTDNGVGSTSYDDFNQYCTYWLRDAVPYSYYGDPAQSIFMEDEWSDYYGFDVADEYNNSNYVRPCIWIDISAIQ